jgi:hypothetical protein
VSAIRLSQTSSCFANLGLKLSDRPRMGTTVANQELLGIADRLCSGTANDGYAPPECASPRLSKAESRGKPIVPAPKNHNHRPGHYPSETYSDQQSDPSARAAGDHAEKNHHQGRDQRESDHHHI